MTLTKIWCLFVMLAVTACESASSTGDQGTAQQDLGPVTQHCCPANFDMYSCQQPDGGMGLACHNPAMGCASSAVCGQGCDPVVSGRCQCVETELCIRGDHFDHTLCKCVPDADAGASCVQNVLCIIGDHFDRVLCRCVPNAAPTDAGTGCVQRVLCIQGDRFDPVQCKCVPNQPPVTAFCTQDADCPAGDVCGPPSPIKCPPTALCIPARQCIPAPADAGVNACKTAADCHGALPDICEVCPNGGTACAHFVCMAGTCEVAICG